MSTNNRREVWAELMILCIVAAIVLGNEAYKERARSIEQQKLNFMTECQRADYRIENSFNFYQKIQRTIEKQNLILQGKCK